MSIALAPSSVVQADPRLAAFCAPDGPEVFSAITHSHQVWTPDPFDIPTIHAEAREMFARLVRRATTFPLPGSGKSLLLLGEAGSGKTHLMRAFRNAVHADGNGYCGYLQLVTRSENYARYVLSNLLDALSQPYRAPLETSGLNRLAGGLLDALDMVPEKERRRLREEELAPQELASLVFQLADAAMNDARFRQMDIDFLRAMLFLVSEDGRIRSRVMKWLRCEDLGRLDREMLGDLVPRPQEHMPLRTIVDLGRLMAAVHQASLVLCVDQLEEIVNLSQDQNDPGEVFRRVIETLITITDVVPTAIVVVACLEDYFISARQKLTPTKLDRLEKDPEPIRLGSKRSEEEIEAIIARRLEHLYESFDLAPSAVPPTFPFRREHLQPLFGLRTRDILNFCRQHHEQCLRAGQWIEPAGTGPKLPPKPPDTVEKAKPDLISMEQRWNDYLSSYKAPLLDEEDRLADLLAWSIQHVSGEMPGGIHFGVESDGRFVPVEVHFGDNGLERLLVAVCDRKAQGGGLGKQVEEVARRAGELPAVLVRSSAFPDSAKAVVAKQIANLVAPRGKGRRVQVQSADWRTMAAFRDFHGKHHQDPAFASWQHEERPLASVPALCSILALNRWAAAATSASRPQPAPAAPSIKPISKPAPSAPPSVVTQDLLLGVTRGAAATPVHITPRELTQHAAFLGGPGSGKTTAALTLIEQLLHSGIPAVLIDRKGDLARYADPAAWDAPDENSTAAARRRQLRERVEVALYTPGSANGRPLTLPLVPADLDKLPASDREQICAYAAAALGGMMGYRSRGVDPKLAILGKAIEVLASLPGREITVRSLHRLIEDQDETLLLTVGGFEARHYRKLAEDLLALSMHRRRLLEGSGEVLDLDVLLGRRVAAGKTRLSIVSTQFLGDADAIDFWLSQFLVALDRWRARNPAPEGRLQAVFLLDEADQYLPAMRQPATKAPMEDLLKRARSAGIGLFLATQSPGDFDYRCRDQVRLWLVGRVKEPVAIGKLRPMFDGKVDPAAKLPGQGTGQFYLVREREVLPVQTERSLMSTVQVPQEQILELAARGSPQHA